MSHKTQKSKSFKDSELLDGELCGYRPGLGGDEPDECPLHLQELWPYHPRQPAPAHKQTP
jgi:hypothetical protein